MQSRPSDDELIQDIIQASNRYMSQDNSYFTEDVIRTTLGSDYENVLDELDKFLECVEIADAQIEVKWGSDDERAFPSVPNPMYTTRDARALRDWEISRSDSAVYLWPKGPGAASAGPVIFWFSPL